MGKPNEGSNPTGNQEGEEVQESNSCCNAFASSICTGKTLKCVVALVLSLNLLAFVVWSLPIFGMHNGSSRRPASANNLQAQIQASFRLQEPISAVNVNIPKLESAIWEEVGVPNTTVTVTSLEPINATNSTEVIFDVLPDPENTYFSPYGLFGLRETFISLLSGSYNLSLEDFGDVNYFELLKFPGGITVVPKQRVFPLQRNSMLFNFTLHSTISQVVQNLAQLRKQLSIGLHILRNENVFVQLTNLQGSTVNPPIIVETFIVPVVGKKGLPTPRLRQLAHEINPSRNLGLNHTLFGKVKQIQLSSYLRDPSSPPPYHLLSPAPLPSQHTSSQISPLSSHPYTSPTHSTPPSCDHHVSAPSPHSTVLAPVSHHHAKSPHYHHGTPSYYHHVVSPSSHHPHVRCDRHHASDPVKCRHARHAPVSGLNGEAPSPSPDIAGPSRHHHRTTASAPRVTASVPPAFPPQNGLSPKAWHWSRHPPFASASPASSRLPHHSAPKSAPSASSGIVSSPKSSHLSPEGLSHSPSPQKTGMSHPDLPEKISPAPAFSYVSSSSYDPNPVQLIIGSLILVGTVLSVLA